MLMRVRERGDQVLIELTGVAGRQQSVLRALSQCREGSGRDEAISAASVSVRSSTNDMRISLQSQVGLPVESTRIYQCLRDALFADPLDATSAASAVRPAV